MREIKLFDYEDEYGWAYYVIGQGDLSASNIISQIDSAKEEELLVRINSVGGSVVDGWAIYNALKAHPKKVTVRIEGIAASIASIIAMAGEEVIVCQASMMMIHKPTIDGFWLGLMDADSLKKEAEVLDKIQIVLNSIYVTKTGLDAKAIDELINVETWLTPNECVMMGFANSIDQTIEEAPVAESSFNELFKNADPKTRAYANKSIKTYNNMSNIKETLDAVKENTETSKGLLAWLNKNVVNVFKNQDEIEPDPVEEEENEEETPKPVEENPDINAELEALKAENEQLKGAINQLQTANKAVNEVIQKLKDTKSTFKPEDRKQTFEKPKNQVEDGKPDLSPEARAARRAEREAIKNKANK